MVLQAAGFAVLAAISPAALVVLSLYLSSANPRRMVALYLAGAVVMTILMALALVIAIRATGLDLPRNHGPRYGLRLGIGILALVIAMILARSRSSSTGRSPARATPGPRLVTTSSPSAALLDLAENPRPRQRTSMIDRLTERPAPRAAFVAGIVLFAPGASFIAAIQVVATARAGTAVTALTIGLVVLLTIAIIWVPFLAYLARPHAVSRWITGSIGWVRRNGRWLTEAALLICGLILVINGSLGLASG